MRLSDEKLQDIILFRASGSDLNLMASELLVARKVVEAAHSLMSEGDAKEGLSHYSGRFILMNWLRNYDKVVKNDP